MTDRNLSKVPAEFPPPILGGKGTPEDPYRIPPQGEAWVFDGTSTSATIGRSLNCAGMWPEHKRCSDCHRCTRCGAA